MTFLDLQHLRNAGSYAPNPDGTWMLYTVSTPDWEEAESQTDIHLVSLREGLSSTRQLTFTDETSERSPTWSQDGGFFAFLSNRDDEDAQLYVMRVDGGEARAVTEVKGGVRDFEFSPDGRWLVYRGGEDDDAQLWRLPVEGLAGAEAEKLTASVPWIAHVPRRWPPKSASAHRSAPAARRRWSLSSAPRTTCGTSSPAVWRRRGSRSSSTTCCGSCVAPGGAGRCAGRSPSV